jgi:hypothetical protein
MVFVSKEGTLGQTGIILMIRYQNGIRTVHVSQIKEGQ